MNWPSVRCAWITRLAAEQQHGREPELRQEADHGLYVASRRVATIAWSKTRPTVLRKRSSWRCSRAKALTTRTPEMFSSASAVSSAMRCWVSWIAGRARRP